MAFFWHTRPVAIRQTIRPCLLWPSSSPKASFLAAHGRPVAFAFRTPSYTLVSAAKLFKNRIRAFPLNCLPSSASNNALAWPKRWRSSLTARQVRSLSALWPSTGLRQWPALVCRPAMPPLSQRSSQLLTDNWPIPVARPTSKEVRPSCFKRTRWQRLRKACPGLCSSLLPRQSAALLLKLFFLSFPLKP